MRQMRGLQFWRLLSVLVAVCIGAELAAALPSKIDFTLAKLRSRQLLQARGRNGIRWAVDKGDKFPKLAEASIDDLNDGLGDGLFTSEDLVNAYIKRIAEVNDKLHCVTEVNPDAVSIAKSLDKERKTGKTRGPLHGIPILIKNNIATADQMNNTAGSYALLGATVPYDSTVVKNLRAAGAIILGKANLSQWANYRSSFTSSGWSAHGGQTEGVYVQGQDPSGSSSGSAVAATLGLAAACVGTETDGSILSPSERSNIIGIKPTVGLTSRHLVIPISEHQDTVGPMARSVRDAAILLSAMAGPDKYDNYTSACPFSSDSHPDYSFAASACSGPTNCLTGIRIGIPTNLAPSPGNPVGDAYNASLTALASSGATLVPLTITPPGPSPWQILSSDFGPNLATYLSLLTTNPQNITSLSSLASFTRDSPLEDFPNRNIGLFNGALDPPTAQDSQDFWSIYQAALSAQGVPKDSTSGVLGAIRAHNLSAIAIPTEDAPDIVAAAGGPVVTVPMGQWPAGTRVQGAGFGTLVDRAPGVPFGLSFLGARWSEEVLVRVAAAFEKVWGKKAQGAGKPYMMPMTEIADVVMSSMVQ